MDIISILGIAGLTVLFQAIIGYFAYKKIIVEIEKLIPNLVNLAIENAKIYAENWINSDTGKKAIYEIGNIVGAGAKASLTGKSSGGKWGWLETLVGLGREFISKTPNQSQEAASSSQSGL